MFKSAMYQGTDLSEAPVDLHDHLTGVVITFTDRWTGIRGAVRTARNQPDDGALVLLFPSDPPRWSNYGPGARRMRSTRTSASGEYSFTSLPADLQMLSASDIKRALAGVRAPASRSVSKTPGPIVPPHPAPAPAAAPTEPPRRVTFAQIFYPGTAAIAQAKRVSVNAGDERGSVDFQMDYVPAATVQGTIVVNAGNPQSAAVMLVPKNQGMYGSSACRSMVVEISGPQRAGHPRRAARIRAAKSTSLSRFRIALRS